MKNIPEVIRYLPDCQSNKLPERFFKSIGTIKAEWLKNEIQNSFNQRQQTNQAESVGEVVEVQKEIFDQIQQTMFQSKKEEREYIYYKRIREKIILKKKRILTVSGPLKYYPAKLVKRRKPNIEELLE